MPWQHMAACVDEAATSFWQSLGFDTARGEGRKFLDAGKQYALGRGTKVLMAPLCKVRWPGFRVWELCFSIPVSS